MDKPHLRRTPVTEVRSSAATTLLLHALATWFGRSFVARPPQETDWKEFLEVAGRTKCTVLAYAGLKTLGIPVPSNVAAELENLQRTQLKNSLANLVTALEVVSRLEDNGIEAIVFKGVPRAYQVYGAWNLRPSGDVDLLVKQTAYRRAAEIIEASGYRPGVSRKSRWWHHYLGEAPYIPLHQGRSVIDLHHRVQQPGGPAPRNLEAFFSAKDTAVSRSAVLPILSRTHALLVTSISFGKALVSRQPWLVYAHEIATMLHALDSEERRALREAARRQGLERLLHDATEAAASLFDMELGTVADRSRLFTSRADLLNSATGTLSKGFRFHRRSYLLLRWTDGAGKDRICRFVAEFCRAKASELRRMLEHVSA